MRLLLFIAITVLPLAAHSQTTFSLQDHAFITSTSPIRNGLTAYWRLEEASGMRYDCSKNGNHLTSNNSVGQAVGKIGYGATNTSASWLSIPNNASLQQSSDQNFTVAAWVKLANVAAVHRIASQWTTTGNQRSWMLYFNGAMRFSFSTSTNGSGTTFTKNADTFGDPSAETWYYVMAWRDGDTDTMGISVNGVEDIRSIAGNSFSSTSDFAIGAILTSSGTPSTGVMVGTVDEVGYWTRVLTPAERVKMYKGGTGTTFPRFTEGSTLPLFPYGSKASSWWVYPLAATLSDDTVLLGYADNAGGQNISLLEDSGTPISNATLASGVVKDDHAAPAVQRLSNGEMLYCWANHDAESRVAYAKASDAAPLTLTTSSQSLSSSGVTSYSQVLTNGASGVNWFYRVNSFTWARRSSADNAETWGSESIVFTDGGPDQLYVLGRRNGASAIRCFVTSHATSANNSIRVAEIDAATGELTSGSGSIAIPAAKSALSELASVTGALRLRLLDANSDGTAIAFCEFEEDQSPSDYKLARLTGPDQFADWTISTITGSGTPFYAASYYVGGVVFANESHSGLRLYVSRETGGTWKIEKWDSAAGDGSDWVTTELASSSVKLLRPVSPSGASSLFPVYWQECPFYSSYLNYSIVFNMF